MEESQYLEVPPLLLVKEVKEGLGSGGKGLPALGPPATTAILGGILG
jgi:hypothetical protein